MAIQLTKKSGDSSILLLNKKESFKAANGKGEAIFEEFLKFSKDENYVVPTRLYYAEKSKAWLDELEKPVIFNIAEDAKVAEAFVDQFKAGLNNPDGKASPAKTDTNTVGGTLTTDSGSALSSDVVDTTATEDQKKSKALKIDKGN